MRGPARPIASLPKLHLQLLRQFRTRLALGDESSRNSDLQTFARIWQYCDTHRTQVNYAKNWRIESLPPQPPAALLTTPTPCAFSGFAPVPLMLPTCAQSFPARVRVFPESGSRPASRVCRAGHSCTRTPAMHGLRARLRANTSRSPCRQNTPPHDSSCALALDKEPSKLQGRPDAEMAAQTDRSPARKRAPAPRLPASNPVT